MLDVHPPEHAAHTWRDFFIHIATIVVGLLIAVGLEQGVEWLHHRHQIETARERIHEEIVVNERIIEQNEIHANEVIAHLDQDLLLLRLAESHQPPRDKDLDFSWNLQGGYDAAYQSAHNTGVLNLLPYDEVAMYADCYKFNDVDLQEMLKLLSQLSNARANMRGHTLQQLSGEEIQTMLTEVSKAREQAVYIRTLGDLEHREWEAALSGHYRNDFAGSAR
jgi:hypothetical protein